MKTIIIFLLLIIPGLAYSQLHLKGEVKDADGHLLDGATLTLIRNQKQTSLAFADLGKFSLSFPGPGSYTIYASLVGYKQVKMDVELPKDSILMVMQADSKQLNEVTVSFKRPLIERKVDRISFNVENSILATGGSTWEALTKAPGVQVNANNNVTANRKNVQVYLDGKPLQLSGDDLSAYLQGMPSDQVAQIEVFSNPPSRFEAAGASVINIVTKKPGKQGFNLTLNSGFTQGVYSGYTGNSTFNYRKNKLNIYGSYGFTHRHTYQDHNLFIDYGDSHWSSPNRNSFQSNNHNYRLGLDYQLTADQVLGFLVTGSSRSGGSEGHTITNVTSQQMKLDSTLMTDNYSSSSGNQYAYNINYNIKLDSGKSSLNIDADYSPYQSNVNALADNVSYLSDGSQTSNSFHIYTPSSQQIDIYSGKIDYNYKIGKRWDLGSGLKYSNTKSISKFDYYNRTVPSFTEVPGNNNHFNYRENTSAVYTSISGALGKWTLQGGMRGELTHTNGYSVTIDSLNKRRYFKLFPTVFAQYKINDDHALQLNYAYRIQRPEYNRLNPAKRFTSPYNVYVGNPGLQPAFVHNVELSYTYKQQFSITAYYTSTHDVFTNVDVQDNQTKVYYGTQANLGLSVNTGIRLSAPFHPASWWDLNAGAEAFRQQEKSDYLTGSFNYHIFSYSASLNQSFTLNSKTGLKAEINGLVDGPGIQGVYRATHDSRLDAGVKTNIMGGRGTLRLAVNDIFNTYSNIIRVDYQDQHSYFFHQVESRTLTLGLSYRLGKNVAASRSRSTSSEEERKRAQ